MTPSGSFLTLGTKYIKEKWRSVKYMVADDDHFMKMGQSLSTGILMSGGDREKVKQ